MNGMLKILAKLKKAGTKGHILCVSIYIKYLEQKIYGDREYVCGCQGLKKSRQQGGIVNGLGFLLGRQDVQELDCGDVCTTP